MSIVTSCTLLSRVAPPAKVPRGALQSGRPAAVALQRKPRPLSVRCAPEKTEKEVTVHEDRPREMSMTFQYPILTRSNYATWAVKMEVFMRAQGVWEAVEGKNTNEHKDQLALMAIFQGVQEETLPLLIGKKKAKDAWDTLQTMYVGQDHVKEARAQTLMSEFESLRMKETESMDDFVMRLMTLVNHIRGLGETMDESYVVKKFLRAVPSKYLQIVSNIEQFNNLNKMVLADVIGRLKVYEERLRISSGNNDL